MLASNAMRSLLAKSARSVLFLAIFLAWGGALRAGAARARLHPRSFVPGETIGYRLQYSSHIVSNSRGPIYTPETAHRMGLSLDALLRLDVLSVKHVPGPGGGALTRLRVTYERSDARVQTDAYDPGAEALEKQYRSLAGRSFTFAIGPNGRVRDVTGLDRLAPDPRARAAIRDWLRSFAFPAGFWKQGRKPGKKWVNEVPLDGAPLAGLYWRAVSRYRDNEACPPAPGAPASIAGETCAAISTSVETRRRGSRGHSTPLEYLRQGLRTSGSWHSQANSLSYISLSTGLVTSSTTTETDQMDFTITSQLSGSSLRYAGQVQSTSQLTLVSLKVPAIPSR